MELFSPIRLGTKRLYTKRDRARLKLILRGKRFGFSLEEIRQRLALYDLGDSQATQIRATREVACRQIGERAYVPVFGNAGRAEVLDRLVTEVMALPTGDPRHDDALQILTDHVVDARAAGANERTALQSALALACMAPSVSGVGY